MDCGAAATSSIMRAGLTPRGQPAHSRRVVVGCLLRTDQHREYSLAKPDYQRACAIGATALALSAPLIKMVAFWQIVRPATRSMRPAVSLARFACQIIFGTILGLWSVNGANAQIACRVDAPRYSLLEDTVTWSMTIANGRSCIRGVRFSNIQFESLKLVSPPQSGEVVLRGPGFIYSPKADFNGRDQFSLLVVGLVRGQRGSSTIQVNVSDSSTQRPVPALTKRSPASSSGDYLLNDGGRLLDNNGDPLLAR